DRSDLVLAGRKREGWTLNLVLDTSGSMTSELGRVLGVIKSFCESASIATVRILQCDDALQADAMVSVESLAQFQILGGSSSDLSRGCSSWRAPPRSTRRSPSPTATSTIPPTRCPTTCCGRSPGPCRRASGRATGGFCRSGQGRAEAKGARALRALSRRSV